MSVHSFDSTEPTVVLVPIRSFDDAKTRLAGALDSAQRHELMRRMAEVVVSAAHELPVRVVTDDNDVAAWARTIEAEPLAVGVLGLNAAITIAVDKTAADGATRIIVAHADLPFADDLRVVGGDGVAIAPDRRRDGSNVLSLPTGTGFRFAYGPGSFAQHRTEAARVGLGFTEIDSAALAWDVDHPDDVPAAWLRTDTTGA